MEEIKLRYQTQMHSDPAEHLVYWAVYFTSAYDSSLSVVDSKTAMVITFCMMFKEINVTVTIQWFAFSLNPLQDTVTQQWLTHQSEGS